MRAFEGADQHKMKLLKEVGKVPNRLFKTKRDAGKLDGTIVLFPTPAMAEEVGLSYEEYCHQFELGLQLDKVDPELAWDMINAELKKTKTRLNQVPLASVIIEGQDFYLELGIGEDRQWLTADGKNIPSYETYITPDWTKTNGNIRFSEPLYYMGNLISGIELIFKNGIITEVKAERNQDFFRNMIAAYANADKVGEFSLTEGGVSPITHLMGSTLFDENRGGPNGNTHIAIGAAYTESKRGEKLTRTDEEWHNDGYNNCPDFHVDIVHTGKFTVHGITASSGIKFLLFKNGKLLI
jgi:aminopeptidase